MNILRVPALALAVSLILLSSYGQEQEPGPPEHSPTPIIVGDGSIHIRPIGLPFNIKNWITTDKKQYRTTDKGLALGRVFLVGVPRKGDWSKPEIIEPIANLTYSGGQVKVTIAGPTHDETITLADERSYRGLVVKSKMGLRDFYMLIDKLGTELRSKGETWTIRRIEILPRRGRVPIPLDEAFLKENCRGKYAGCGISIDVFHGTSPGGGRGAVGVSRTFSESK